MKRGKTTHHKHTRNHTHKTTDACSLDVVLNLGFLVLSAVCCAAVCAVCAECCALCGLIMVLLEKSLVNSHCSFRNTMLRTTSTGHGQITRNFITIVNKRYFQGLLARTQKVRRSPGTTNTLDIELTCVGLRVVPRFRSREFAKQQMRRRHVDSLLPALAREGNDGTERIFLLHFTKDRCLLRGHRKVMTQPNFSCFALQSSYSPFLSSVASCWSETLSQGVHRCVFVVLRASPISHGQSSHSPYRPLACATVASGCHHPFPIWSVWPRRRFLCSARGCVGNVQGKLVTTIRRCLFFTMCTGTSVRLQEITCFFFLRRTCLILNFVCVPPVSAMVHPLLGGVQSVDRILKGPSHRQNQLFSRSSLSVGSLVVRGLFTSLKGDSDAGSLVVFQLTSLS